MPLAQPYFGVMETSARLKNTDIVTHTQHPRCHADVDQIGLDTPQDRIRICTVTVAGCAEVAEPGEIHGCCGGSVGKSVFGHGGLA